MNIPKPEDKSEIIHLNKLKDKLLDLSSRSRKIRFSISKWLTWDLSELLNSNRPELVSNFLSSLLNLVVKQGEDKIDLSLDLESFLKPLSVEDSRKFQEKIIFLQKKNLAIYQEKGYKSLFVGIFFFRGYFYNNKNILRLVNAPLFLIPCELKKLENSNLNLVFNSLKKINYNLLYFFQKELNIPKNKFTNFLKKIEKDNKEIDKWEDYLIFLNKLFQELLSFGNVKLGFSSTISSLLEGKLSSTEINKELIFDPFSEPNLNTNESNINKFVSAEPFVKLTLSKKPQNYQKNYLEIILNFCLTVDSETNLSLVHDFEQIIHEYSENDIVHWSKSALSLLRGETESVLTYHEKKEVDKQTEILYNPFPSDPSQTRILRTIFQNFSENTLCIDGPPGTGKSQLICNLLANSLFYRKKVLVVCEKEVALRVIYDKLASLGLKHSMIKINELNQTSQVYQQILSVIESNQKEEEKRDVSSIAEQISKLEEKRKTNLKKIEDYYKVEKEFYDNYRISLREVYIKFERKNLTSEIIQLSRWINNQEELDKLKTQLENYLGRFTKIFTKWKPICLRLKGLFLKGDYQEIKFDLENRNELQEAISDILKELNGEKTKVNLLSQILRINLWQKYSKPYPWITLLATKIDDLKKLQTEKKYQKLFAFLEIRDFSDFWQKFNDKEFLFSVQRFISEEFLIMSDLPDFAEKYQHHLNYFLKKILVNQELNYFDSYEKITEQATYFNWIKKVEEENKEILANWNYDQLVKIQQEQKEIIKKKTSLVINVLKIRQQENLNGLFTDRLLKKEVSKKRKLSSLKKLFPELINYYSIWLSTPQVIASITSLQEPIFDFLVFDEASQIPLEKSIPLLARAKKCIVIGDEQQLPPTDFFKSHLENDEEIWEEEENSLSELEEKINLGTDDLEKNVSLLNYAKTYVQSKERLTLLYHYRSEYPELIEFSNQAFYNGVLQIVSASKLKKIEDLPIKYCYQEEGRWINNENEVEARYIIELLKTLPEDKEVGIITFNSKQRDLLLDKIDEGNKINNLFIKSLEDVQGDERDIIIFSVGYAPNSEGKILLNFGPLSKEGGEKRLNVAISRAKEKLIMVTSLLPNDLKKIVDEDENRKLGPRLFKKYLEYAYYCWKKQGEKTQEILEKSLPKIVNSSLYESNEEIGEFGSLFEEQVYNELVKLNYRNYEIHKQVKSVGYRIDLALWNKKIQQYVIGIECDGEYWHGKLENIERDIYRQQLLENKGWKILRILSRDWCRNKEREIERIKDEINLLS